MVEDSSAHLTLIERAFRGSADLRLESATSVEQARRRIESSAPDVALVDYLLPDGSGLDLLPEPPEKLGFPIVIMTSHGNEEVAVEAMKRGALDYVVKSAGSLGDLPKLTRRALREHRLVRERERARAAVRQSEEQYRAVFEASINGLTIRRLEDAEPIAVNPAMAEMLGYSRDEFLRLRPEDYVPAEHLGEWRQAVERVRQGGRARFEIQNLRRDGSRADIEGHFVPCLYQGELHILGVVSDISDRKVAERQMEMAIEEIARLRDELEQERDYLREEVNVALRYGEIVGESEALGRVLRGVEAVADTNATVLILGESGVGKELVARAIHARSPRRDNALVKVNCATVPRELFESEFFGHVRGAFTSAHRDRVGRFELANRGTLFLDEVGEIPPELQGKLLRVLQEREFERVGEAVTRAVDVRVLAATNRDLESLVSEGRFRQDLYYRLTVFPIEVPPLRRRRRDIVPLARHFLAQACREFERPRLALTQYQAGVLERYEWPGNVRELRNVIERAVLLSRGSRLRLELALPDSPSGRAGSSAAPAPADTGFVTAAEMKRRERRNLVAALDRAGWKVSGPGGAAELLEIKPSTLAYKMKSFGIKRPPRGGA